MRLIALAVFLAAAGASPLQSSLLNGSKRTDVDEDFLDGWPEEPVLDSGNTREPLPPLESSAEGVGTMPLLEPSAEGVGTTYMSWAQRRWTLPPKKQTSHLQRLAFSHPQKIPRPKLSAHQHPTTALRQKERPELPSWDSAQTWKPDVRDQAVRPSSEDTLPKTSGIRFEVECDETVDGYAVFIVGSVPELGAWNPVKGLEMFTSEEEWPVWHTGGVSMNPGLIQYKFIMQKEDRSDKVFWEEILDNRQLLVRPGHTATVHTIWGNSTQHVKLWGPPPPPPSVHV